MLQISPEQGEFNFGPSGVVWHLAETVERSDHKTNFLLIPTHHSPPHQSHRSRWVLGRLSKKLVVQISPEQEEFNCDPSRVVWRPSETVERTDHETNCFTHPYLHWPPFKVIVLCEFLGECQKNWWYKYLLNKRNWNLALPMSCRDGRTIATRKRKNFLIYFFLAVCLRSSSSIVQDTNRSSHYQQKI